MSSQSQELSQSDNSAPKNTTDLEFDNTNPDYSNLDFEQILSYELQLHLQSEEVEEEGQVLSEPEFALQDSINSPTTEDPSAQPPMPLPSEEAENNENAQVEFDLGPQDPTQFLFEDWQLNQPQMQLPPVEATQQFQPQFQFAGVIEQDRMQFAPEGNIPNQPQMQFPYDATQQIQPQFLVEGAAMQYPAHLPFENGQFFHPPFQLQPQHLAPNYQTPFQFGGTEAQQPLSAMYIFGSTQHPPPMLQPADQLNIPSNPVSHNTDVRPPVSQPLKKTRAQKSEKAPRVMTHVDNGFVNTTVAPTRRSSNSPRRRPATKEIPWIWDQDGPDKDQRLRNVCKLLDAKKAPYGYIVRRLPGCRGAIEYVGTVEDPYAINVSEKECQELGINHIRKRKIKAPIDAPNDQGEPVGQTNNPLLEVPQNLSTVP